MFILLLRLRQLCCHPALMKTMLEEDTIMQSGIMENMDIDLLSLNEIDKDPKKDININEGIIKNLFTVKNPVFDNDRISSKVCDNCII